jgi:hypothetical protein
MPDEAELSALYDAVLETIKRHLEQRTEKIERSAYVSQDNPRAREAMKNEALAAMRKVIDGTAPRDRKGMPR